MTKFLSEELKEEAEAILQELEIPMSTAQEIFYRQIIAYRGLPFELRVPQKELPAIQAMEKARAGKGDMPAWKRCLPI